MLTYKIHLIRHGLTEGNVGGKYIGRTDLSLCEEGIRELQRLKREYDYPAAQMVVSSPLRRCLQTADILYPDLYTEQWEDFVELDFGAFEGKGIEELQHDEHFSKWLESGMQSPPPGGESGLDLTKRISVGISRLFKKMMDEQLGSVALITHGGVIMNLLYGMGLPKCEVSQWAVDNGKGYTILMTPQFWMRDRAFEVYAPLPYGLSQDEVQMDTLRFIKPKEET